jgi:hypothetical protein
MAFVEAQENLERELWICKPKKSDFQGASALLTRCHALYIEHEPLFRSFPSSTKTVGLLLCSPPIVFYFCIFPQGHFSAVECQSDSGGAYAILLCCSGAYQQKSSLGAALGPALPKQHSLLPETAPPERCLAHKPKRAGDLPALRRLGLAAWDRQLWCVLSSLTPQYQVSRRRAVQ